MSGWDKEKGSGEARELLYGKGRETFVLGDLLAYQGKEGCLDVRCSRVGYGREGRCVGWHCPHCHEPCSSQGHECSSSPGVSGK